MSGSTAIEDLAYGRIGRTGGGNGMICGLVEPNVEDNLPTSSHFGWVPEGTFVYGSMRTADGDLYTCYRKLGTSSTLGLMITGARGGTDRRSKRQPEARASFRGEFEQGIDSGGAHVAWCPPGVSRPNSPMQPMRVVRTPTTISWDEGDILSLEGTLVGGKGNVVMLPGPVETGGMYAVYMHYATGHVCGQEVTGMLGWSMSFFAPGVSWWTHEWWRTMETVWVDIGIRYSDGTLEAGTLCAGRNGFGGCILQRDGVQLISTPDVVATVTRNERLWPDRVDFVIGGDTRAAWTLAPRGEIAFPFIPGEPDIYRNADGDLRFEGNDCEQTAWTGWIDTYIDGRDGFNRPTPPELFR